MDRVFPTDDPRGYRSWALAHPWCMACLVPASKAPYPGLANHHIIKFGRTSEPCCLLRACGRCHDLFEGRQVRLDGILLPKLTLGVALTLKQMATPDEWNPTRLQELYGQTLPEREPIPDWLLKERARWCPVELTLWLPGGTPIVEVTSGN